MKKSTPERIIEKIIDKNKAAEQRAKGVLDNYLLYGNEHKGRKGTMQNPCK